MSAIKQIVIFQLKALRMAGFLEFVQQVLNIVRTYRDSGEAGVSQLPAKVEAAYTPFVAGVAKVDEAYKISHSSEYTQQIADEDARRDSLYTALKKQVQMYTKFTFDVEKKSAAMYLWNIIKKYNVDVNENYSEESVKLQQMLQEIEDDTTASGHITALGLASLVAQLKTSNEAVRTLLSQRNDERMQKEKAALANARNAADEAYRELVLKLNASAVIEDNTEGIEGVISQVNELIKYYRQYVLPKYGKGDKENEGEGSDKPNGGENQGGNGGSQNGGTNSGTGDNGGSQSGGDNGNQNQGGGTSQGGDNGGGDNGDEPDQ